MASLIVLAAFAATAAGDETSAGKQYQALVAEYEQEGGARLFAPRFLEFAEKNAGEAAAVDALLWVVENVRGKAETTRALEMLAQDHLGSDKLGPACRNIANARSVAAEKLLRDVLQKNPHKSVRAQACFQLHALLAIEANILDQLKAQPQLAPRVLQYYGKDYGAHLAALDAAELSKQRERALEQLRTDFADVAIQDSTMGEYAAKALFAIRHLSVGRKAPEIKGEDVSGKPLKLSDYRGKVVMLTFWGHW